MTSFYWASGLLHEPGDVIQPGNWGKTVLGTGLNHPSFQREVVFELYREQHFSHLPSRLSSLMVVRTQAEAGPWHEPDGVCRHLYELELVDPDTDVSTVVDGRSMDAWGLGMHTMTQVRTHAALYWQGQPNPGGLQPAWEVLVPGPMKVVRRIMY